MSTDREVTGIVRSWLETGVTRLPDRVLDQVLDQLPTTPQRRAWWPARRFREMNAYSKLAIAAAAIVVVAIAGFNLLPRTGGVGTPAPTASPTQTAAPTPTPMPTATPTPTPVPTGVLAPGTYTQQPFAFAETALCMRPPQPGCTESAADDSIRVTFTVPGGWETGGAGVYRPEGVGPPGGAALIFFRGGWLYTKPCGTAAAPEIPTGTTVDEFVTALVDHPDLDVTDPEDVTLAGYSGKYLELRAPANIATDSDAPGPNECAYYFVWNPGIYAQGPNQLWHIWVLDVAGSRVVIRMDTFPGTTPRILAELQAIVESLKITP
jgi:hypothetical protein